MGPRNYQDGRLAQLGERYPYKVDVGGSIPSTPTIFLKSIRLYYLF